MKFFLIVVFLAGLFSIGRADTDPSKVASLLKAQADQWDKAIVAKDVSGIKENIGNNFRHIDGDGNISTRDVFIAELLSADLRIDPYTVEDLDIRIYGETALLCGRTRMTGKYKDKVFRSHYRYVDTYHLEDGHWRVVNFQITRILK